MSDAKKEAPHDSHNNNNNNTNGVAGGGGRDITNNNNNAMSSQMTAVPAVLASPAANRITVRQQQQQQQQQPNEQHVALAEAQAVLDAIGGEHYLDGFNLLQVIANPWGTSTSHGGGGPTSSSTSNSGSSSSNMASYHGRYNSGVMTSSSRHGHYHHQHMAGIGGGGGGTDGTGAIIESDIFQGTYHTLESTVVQVTEQMEALNSVLEDWSRHLLSDDPNGTNTSSGTGGGGDDAVPESQLQELPAHLQNLNLEPLQLYLERSGQLALGFCERHPPPSSTDQRQQEEENDEESSATGPAAASSLIQTLQGEIPDSFWQGPDALDLTDPVTFQALFLTSTNSDTATTTTTTANNSDIDNNNDISIYSWFPLVPPDALNPSLDHVELALLEAVRQQSGAFFEESVRFATLQQVISSLLSQVVVLQHQLDNVIGGNDYLQPLLQVPIWDSQKKTWQRLILLLDCASELLTCKQSIAGFLAAADDKTALEQIQYARRQLLMSISPSLQQSETSSSSSSSPSCCLNQLIAFSSVGRQLDQYEQLIVTNLREELVEVFLDWKVSTPPPTTTAAASAAMTTTTTTTAMTIATSSSTVDRVRDIMSALRHCHALQDTRTAYHNRLQDVMRLTVRTVVGEFAAEQQQQSSSSSSSFGGSTSTTSTTTTAMTLERFLDCFDLTAEQLLALLQSASQVDAFCAQEGFTFCDDENGENADDHVKNNSTGIDSQQQQHQSSSSFPLSPEVASPATTTTPMSEVLVSAAELSSKSMSELLRLRKDAHSLVTLEEMKRIWDKCLSFTTQLEALSGGRTKATALRSTLLAQAKAFCDRQHESNMSALVAALDSERWTQCEVSAERQGGLTRLCSGRSVWSSSSSSPHLTLGTTDTVGTLSSSSSAAGSFDYPLALEEKKPQVEVEGIRYKVVWSCLLLVEMILGDLAAAAHFHSLASSVVAKVAELLRLFNSRTTQLVLGAGAIHSAARLKSINAKHLSLVTQCLGMVIAILPHVRAALMAQMPTKQHTLLIILDQIKREYGDHNEKVLNKFVTIIGSIVEHGLTPKLSGTDFDKRAEQHQQQQQQNANDNDNETVSCCVFLDGVSTNTRKMHQVLFTLLPPEHLQDVFSRIFAFVDQKIPTLLVSMAENDQAAQGAGNVASGTPKKAPVHFSFPTTDSGKRQLLLEVECMTNNLNALDGVQPWDFTAVTVLEKKLEYTLLAHQCSPLPNGTDSGNDDDQGNLIEKESSELDSEAETDVTTDPGDADENRAASPNNPLLPETVSAATSTATTNDTCEEAAADAGPNEASTGYKAEAPTAAAAADESKIEATENGSIADYPAEVTAL